MTELNLSVTIPDEKAAEVIDGLARQNGWTEMVENDDNELVPNPITKGQWVKRWTLGNIRASWKAWNDQLAKEAAFAAQDEDGSDFT